MSVNVTTVVVGDMEENCHIVRNGADEALVIDPGAEAEKIVEAIEATAATPLAILLTHAHFDHIGAVEPLKSRYRLPLYLHKKEEKLLKSANLYTHLFGKGGKVAIPKVDYYVDRLENPFSIGMFAVRTIETPGHTKGGVTFAIGDAAFTGDTLLKGATGSLKFPGANKELLIESLKTLATLPPETRVYAGHGEPTTISEELETNERFQKALSKGVEE
ncbi:MAG: MBL fold metallo-hydrolase [Ignavibacteriales bacterium]|nr:MBL fold metallo-hydrolase [Ignavibacteriales bacterium]